jgi:RNA polymerase sigma-70 factor (ECF subfamily)
MNEYVGSLSGPLVTTREEVAREFEVRVSESSRLAVRVAYSVVRNQADAEDVAQDAFVRAHRSFAALRDRDKFRAWLVRMTWRLALDWKRGHRRRWAREDSVARSSPMFGDAEREAMESERSRRLWAAIDELPERLRFVVVLSAIDGHTTREVATLLGIPDGTVKSRLFDAKRQLLERLQ